jgi:hypothetical protein
MIIAVGGTYWSAYSQRPVISYSLGSETQSYVSSPNSPLAFDFRSMNTGQTPAVITVTISATNATVSSQSKDQYANAATQSVQLGKEDTTWGIVTFYVIPDADVASFGVTIVSVVAYNNPSDNSFPSSNITSFIIRQTAFQKISPQTLTYVKNDQASNTYSLQP